MNIWRSSTKLEIVILDQHPVASKEQFLFARRTMQMETSVDNDLSLQTEQCSLRMYYKQTERKKATFKWKNADYRKSENHNGLGWLAGLLDVPRWCVPSDTRPSWRVSVTRSPAAYDKRIVLRTHFVHTYPHTPGTNMPFHTPYFCRSNYSW